MEDRAKKLLQYFENHLDNMVDMVGKMAAMESPSQNRQSQQPLFYFLEKEFNKLDFLTHHFSGKNTGGFLLAYPADRKKFSPIQLLLGHVDTVWDLGTLQNMPIVEKNGTLSGPGVYDMKAGIAQTLFALKAIRHLGLPTPMIPVCLFNSDEEIGSRESTAAIRRLAKIAQRAYVMEPPLGREGKLKTARKGLGRFTLTIFGKAAHAGLDPEKGVNAILELSHQIQLLHEWNDHDRGISINIGMIEGGISPNVVAPTSKAVIDVRVLTLQDAAMLTNKIHSLQPFYPGSRLQVEGGFGRLPMEKTPPNRALWQLATLSAQELGFSLEEGTSGGGSDGNTTSQYTATLDGLGITGDGAHAAHEFIFTHALIERTALLTLLISAPSIASSSNQ